MVKEEKTVKCAPLLSTNKAETEIQENNVESMGMTPFGELFAEVYVSPKGKKIYANRYIHRDNVCIPIGYPPSFIKPDMLYPYRELQMTQTRFNEMDFVPADSWVKESFRDDNGQLIRDTSGREIYSFFWCKLTIKALREEEECRYGDIKYMLGSDLIKYSEAKDIVGGPLGNSTRQRVEDETDMVEV